MLGNITRRTQKAEGNISPKTYGKQFPMTDDDSLYLFLPRDASAERGDATVSRLSVCLSVCDVAV